VLHHSDNTGDDAIMKRIIFLTFLILLTISAAALAIIGTQALKLDGKQYVEMKNCKALNDIKTQLTVEARIRVKAFTNEWMPIIYKGDGALTNWSGRSYTLWINRHGFIHFTSAPENHSQMCVESQEGSIKLNRWHHIAGVIDCAARRMILYLDGNIVAKTDYSNRIRQSRLPLLLGWCHENDSQYGYFNGMIDEIRIWNVVRTQDEILKKVRKPLKGNENGLVGYWTFDDTTARDHSPSQNHGRLKKCAKLPKVRYAANRSQSWFFYGLRDIGGVVTADGRKMKKGQVYLSGIPPLDTILQFAKKGRIKTVINYLVAWEMARYQWYDWSKKDGFNVFHFPYGWTNNPRQWEMDWRSDRKSVIAQLVLKCHTPIKETFAVLANEKNYPVLYYCRGGIDRSIIMTGILYLALGVSEKQIFDGRGQKGNVSRNSDRQWVLKTVFYNINKCGGINNYLKHIGVPREHVENFRRNMLIKN